MINTPLQTNKVNQYFFCESNVYTRKIQSNFESVKSLCKKSFAFCFVIFFLSFSFTFPTNVFANESIAKTEIFKITAYCACTKCCGKNAKGICASGVRPTKNHTVALNWLPFGTKVLINGNLYVVQDRGAESLFGTYYHRKCPKNKIKHIDIYMNSHQEAKNFGVKYLPVQILGAK